jgi:uncharacterized protein (TIGR03435 family)
MRVLRCGFPMMVAALALGQNVTPNSPTFEVVSVKPHPLPAMTAAFRFHATTPGPPVLHATGNRFVENTATVQELIMDAYGIEAFRISGLADWTLSPKGEHFDIDARAGGDGTPTPEQLQLMLQNVLADRFQLKLHREMRPLPVFALVIAKNGPKIREISKEAFDNRPRFPRMPARWPELTQDTMNGIVDSLIREMDRPVVDQTGLTGYYEFATPEWMQPDWDRRTDPLGAQAAVFSELEARMGLKLEPRKDPIEVLVIDHVERPSPN